MANTRGSPGRDKGHNDKKKDPLRVPPQAPPRFPIDSRSMKNVEINQAF